MTFRLGLCAVVAFMAASAEAGTVVRLAGRVVDAFGKPAAEARVAEIWFAEQSAPLEPSRPVLSNSDGRFSLEVELHGRDSVVMAMDRAGTLGGVVIVSANSTRKPIEIELQPLTEVRVRHASQQPDRSLNETYLTVSVGDKKLHLARGRSRDAEFAIKLPPGQYTLHGHEARHDEDVREFTLEAGKDLDLGVIELHQSKSTRLIGQAAPAWHFTDARRIERSPARRLQREMDSA